MGQDKVTSLREWISPEQAAVVSGFSVKTIYRAIWSGELPAGKRRRRWRIRPEALAFWVDGERNAEPPTTPSSRARKTTPPAGSLGKLLAAQEGDAA